MKVQYFRVMENTLQEEINRWLKEVKPLIYHVTHIIHANSHHVTVWYMDGE